MGTGGSRSTTMSGGAIVMVSDKIITKGKKLAAHILEASEADLEFKEGRFNHRRHRPRPRHHEVAKAAFRLEKLPRGMEPGLYETATYRAHSGNFPNGAHVCEVEIDPDTGATQLVGYAVVDDVGTVINPMLVKGQIMGGIAQGIGQVADGGQGLRPADRPGHCRLVHGLRHACARRISAPSPSRTIRCRRRPIRSESRARAKPARSAVSAGVNAIVDALSVYGIRHVDTPCTPYRVWQAIQAAKRGK